MNLKLIFFPLTLVISVAIFIWVAKPEWESLKANKAELTTLTEKRDKLESNKQNIQKAYNQYEALDEADIQLINNAIPFDANNDDFIAEIYKNIQQSGAFLAGTELKEGKGDDAEYKKCIQAQEDAKIRAASGEAEDEEAEAPAAPAYCPSVKNVTAAKTDTVGNFANIKEFVKMVDTQNRLIVPSKLLIEKLTSSSDADGIEISGDMLKSSLSFDFFDKQKDGKIALSALVDGNDKVLNSLMQGAINSQAIEAFKTSITSEAFRPVTVEEMGKADIFAE